MHYLGIPYAYRIANREQLVNYECFFMDCPQTAFMLLWLILPGSMFSSLLQIMLYLPKYGEIFVATIALSKISSIK